MDWILWKRRLIHKNCKEWQFLFISDIALSSDFIAGFCGETEAAHEETLSLMREVKYNVAYCFPYSMRQVI